MITWLASYPRSGNTFARIGLFCLFGIPCRSIYPAEDDARTIDKIIGKPLPEMTPVEMSASPDCFFAKTHEMPGSEPWPAVYLVRDGRDTLVSYAHYILHEEHGVSPASDRELFVETLQDLIIGRERFGGWASHVVAWTQRTAPTSVVHFEDLIAEPDRELRQALIAVGELPPVRGDASLPIFEKLHDVVPWFFRKGRVGAWRTEMPPYLQALFWSLHGEVMRELGYDKEGRRTRLNHIHSDEPQAAERLDKDQDRGVAAIVQQVRRADALEAIVSNRLTAIQDRDRVIGQLEIAAAERLAAIEDRDRVIAELQIAATERLAAIRDRDRVIAELNAAANERLTALVVVDAALEEARSEIRSLRSELEEVRRPVESQSLRE